MNEKQKDKGLMKAVKEQPQFRLTSNFTFRTMQKVEEAILLREKKQERKKNYLLFYLKEFLVSKILIPYLKTLKLFLVKRCLEKMHQIKKL